MINCVTIFWKEIIKNRRKINILDARNVEHNIIRHSLALFWYLVKKRAFLFKNGFDHLLMMSCLVAIVTDSCTTFLKMFLRNMHAGTENGMC